MIFVSVVGCELNGVKCGVCLYLSCELLVLGVFGCWGGEVCCLVVCVECGKLWCVCFMGMWLFVLFVVGRGCVVFLEIDIIR